MIIALDERLENPGDTLPVAGHLDEQGYSLGGHDFSLPSGIDYDLVLTNAGEGILATGMVRAHVVGTCDRCLEEADFDVAGEMDEYYLFHAPEQQQQADDEDEDVDFSLVSPDHTVDLSEAVWAALLMDTPFVVLCKPDCKGLCPVCGHNLNEGDCGHLEQVERERRAANNPFAALSGIDFSDVQSKDDSRKA